MGKLYFGQQVDDAISVFKKEEDLKKKHKVYIEIIMPAFEKLVNYHYYRLPVARNPDIMHDCLVFLYEQIGKFDENRFKRGFPYFNMIVKNFFIQKLKSEKKQVNTDQLFESISDLQTSKDLNLITDDIEDKFEGKQFIEIVKEKIPEWKEKTTKKQEKIFLDALSSLFENAENIDIYNKKAIFFYLREITGFNSKQIASNLNKIKKKYITFKKKYKRGEI